jgi:heme-degrading monooxygenase HmoA
MYARSTTVQGSPEKLDETTAYIHDQVLPMVEQMDGCVGLSMLADRGSGRCIITTAWETAEAGRASADAVRASRARTGEILGGEPEVAEWEIVLVHRVRPADRGACTRVIWGSRDAGRMDEDLDAFRMTLIPKMEELPGFCSVSLLADRAHGRTATAVTYESREAMERANEQAAAMREEFTRAIGMEIADMAEFDLVIAHLRVPELV